MFTTTEAADTAHANAAFIPGAEGFPPRWQARAAAFRAGLGGRARLDLAYGADPAQRLDLFLPEGAARGLMLFVHGGYWMAFGRADWSHLAAGALARGWACAMPSYRLAPDAGLPDMRADVTAALGAARAEAGLAGPIVATGHSAGGQLVARLACADCAPQGLARVVPISPLADLSTLVATGMNDRLAITDAVVAAESPARHPLAADVAAHVWVGGQERPLFLWQARTLSEAWSCPWTVEAGRHHFDVIDGLEDPASPLMAACLGGL